MSNKNAKKQRTLIYIYIYTFFTFLWSINNLLSFISRVCYHVGTRLTHMLINELRSQPPCLYTCIHVGTRLGRVALHNLTCRLSEDLHGTCCHGNHDTWDSTAQPCITSGLSTLWGHVAMTTKTQVIRRCSPV